MSKALLGLAVLGAPAVTLAADVDWVPVISLVLALLVAYASRRDIADRSQAQLTQLVAEVRSIERDLTAAQDQLQDQGRRLTALETELYHRPTLSEIHALMRER